MISINLLPTEFRRKVEQPEFISLRFGMILAVLIAVLVWVGLSFMQGTSKRELNNLAGDWSRLESGSKEADQIMLDINENFLERKKTCDFIAASDMSWAYVLNQASDLLPETAWLRKIKLSRTGLEEWEFRIKGLIRSPENEPAIKVVGRFVSSLKPAMEKSLKKGEPLIDVTTSTDQETIGDVVLTSFEGIFTQKGKQDESVRDKSKNP